MIRKAADPDEDVEQRIPSVTRPGSDLDWLSDPEAGLPGTEQVTGVAPDRVPRHIFTWKPCAPWPYPGCTTR